MIKKKSKCKKIKGTCSNLGCDEYSLNCLFLVDKLKAWTKTNI